MNALPVPKPGLMTVGEFLDWPGDGTDTRWELVGGEPVAQALATEEHAELQGRLMAILTLALQSRPPCWAIPEVPMYKSRRHVDARGADLVVTSKDRKPGEPIQASVVFEIVSPSNRQDTFTKPRFYAGFPSVQEIVLVDSRRVSLTVYRRKDDDWGEIPDESLGVGDTLHLRSIDVSILLDDIYRTILT